MTRYTPIGLSWKTLRLGENGFGSDVERARRIERRMHKILGEWGGSRYSKSQCRKGEWAYCSAFVCHYLDELYRRPLTPLLEIPHDIAFHSREGAISGLRWFLRRFPAAEALDSLWVEPGDILITAPVGGGPGHAIVVGPGENSLWQASGTGVYRGGMALPEPFLLHSVFRMFDRECWA